MYVSSASGVLNGDVSSSSPRHEGGRKKCYLRAGALASCVAASGKDRWCFWFVSLEEFKAKKVHAVSRLFFNEKGLL